MNKQTNKKINIRSSPCEEDGINKSQNMGGKLYTDPLLPTTVAVIYCSCALLWKKSGAGSRLKHNLKQLLGYTSWESWPNRLNRNLCKYYYGRNRLFVSFIQKSCQVSLWFTIQKECLALHWDPELAHFIRKGSRSKSQNRSKKVLSGSQMWDGSTESLKTQILRPAFKLKKHYLQWELGMGVPRKIWAPVL